MKKRLLALALTLVMVFSMFGASLSASAKIDANGAYEAYTATKVANIDTFWGSPATVADFQAILAKIVADPTAAVAEGKIYLYDFYGGALLTAWNDAKLAVLNTNDGGTLSDELDAAKDALTDLIDAGNVVGNSEEYRASILLKAATAYDVLDTIDGDTTAIWEADGLYEGYNIAALKTALAGAASLLTSEVKALLADYDLFDAMFGFSATVNANTVAAYERALAVAKSYLASDYDAASFIDVQSNIALAETYAALGKYSDAMTYLTAAGTVAFKPADVTALRTALQALYKNKLIAGATYAESGAQIVYPKADFPGYFNGQLVTEAYYLFAINTINPLTGVYDQPSIYAKAYAALTNTRQSAVDAILAELNAAVAALEVTNFAPAWEIARLEAEIAKADKVNPVDYRTTTLTWKNFETAVATAKAVVATATPGARAVDDAYTALANYFDGSNPLDAVKASTVAAKMTLTTLVNKATALLAAPAGKYEALIVALQNAKTNALNIDTPTAALLSKVLDATEKLEKAIADYEENKIPTIADGWTWDKEAGWSYYIAGEKMTGWIFDEDYDAWYYMDEDGIMANKEWIKIDGTWYWLKSGGAMAEAEWELIDGKWYYFKASGAMVSGGWMEIGGVWYYFYESGAMAANTTINGYKVNASGAWVK